MHTAAYIRVSTDEQAREGFSIDAQARVLQAYCVVKNLPGPTLYIDDGYTAKNTNRPQLQRLLTECRNGNVSTVLVWRLDRFTRSTRDMTTILEDVLQPKRIDFVSATESIDTSTTSGRFLLNILASFAQSERETISERVHMVMTDLAHSCRHLGGVPPFGYKVVDRFYQIDEECAPAVRKVFDMFVSGAGYGAMLNYLNDYGYKTVRGNPFDKNTLYDILGNEKYCGTYTYNKREAAGRDGTRNDHKHKPEDEIIRVPNGIPAIVDMQTWRKAVAMRKNNKTAAASYHSAEVYLLSGLVYCGVCGKKMIGQMRGRDRDGTKQRYYCCGEKDVKAVRKEKLEASVMNAIHEYLENQQLIREAEKIINDFAFQKEADAQAEPLAIRKRLREIDAEYNSAIDRIQKEGADAPATLMGDIKRLRDERIELGKELRYVESITVYMDGDALIRDLQEAWNRRNSPLDEKKPLVQRAISKVVVHDGDIKITVNMPTFSGGEGN